MAVKHLRKIVPVSLIKLIVVWNSLFNLIYFFLIIGMPLYISIIFSLSVVLLNHNFRILMSKIFYNTYYYYQ